MPSSKKDTLVKDKSDFKANTYRELGNKLFKQQNMMEALLNYNKSISFANTKKAISLAYANRSAVYIEMDRYDDCLQNIKFARANGYPKDKIEKLIQREERCKKLAEKKGKDYENPLDLFKLSYPANEKIPWIADCVEMKSTKKYGRGIYAKKDLKAGDIISIEEPVFFMLTDDAYYKNCNNCFKSCMMNLIPCDRTASMMFCSNECKQQFYLKSLNMKTILNDDVKLLSFLVDGFGGKANFDEFLKENDLKSLNKSIFDYDFSKHDDPKYKENLMMCFLSLSSDRICMNDKNSNIETFVSKKVARHLRNIEITNVKYSTNSIVGSKGSISNCYPLFASLMNHSCLNNVEFVTVGQQFCSVVMKPVKAGEQLFCCYFDKNSRLGDLDRFITFSNQSFKCDCEVCEKKIQLFEPDSQFSAINHLKYELQGTYLSGMKCCLKDGWDYINKHEGYTEKLAYHTKLNIISLRLVAYHAFFPREDNMKLFNVSK